MANTTVSSMRFPTWQTYRELFGHAVYYSFSRHDCEAYSQSALSSDLIFYISFFNLFYYIHIMLIICTRKQLHTTFRICATVLFFGDVVILVTSWREGILYSCAFYNNGDYTIAWESLGTFAMDLRCATNCLLAVVRFACIHNFRHPTALSIVGGVFCVCCATASFLLSTTGNLKVIWYEGDTYMDSDIEPYTTIRRTTLLVFISASFLIYILCILKALRLKFMTSVKRTQLGREILILTQCLLIFIGELLFLYATFWIGYHWGIGDEHFNATLYFVFRPLSAVLTPILYTIFVSEIRKATFIAVLSQFRCVRQHKPTTQVTMTNASKATDRMPNGNANRTRSTIAVTQTTDCRNSSTVVQ